MSDPRSASRVHTNPGEPAAPPRPKPPTRTRDEELALAVRQLTEHVIGLAAKLDTLHRDTRHATRTRSLSVAFGTFCAMAIFVPFGWVVLALIGGILGGAL